MNIFQDKKMGDGSTPEFEEEAIVFIRMDVFLSEFEDYFQNNTRGVTHYTKEELEEWK